LLDNPLGDVQSVDQTARTPESCCSTIPLLTLPGDLPSAPSFLRRRNAALNSEALRLLGVQHTNTRRPEQLFGADADDGAEILT